jgi:uncharacterized protein
MARAEGEIVLRLVQLIAVTLALASCSASAQSPDLADRLFALSRAGNAEASYHLGMLYNNGAGVAQDNRRALALFRASAEGGDPLGAYKLGCYFAGQFGVIEPDEDQALRYKLVAAEAGYSLAQLDVGILYYVRGSYGEALPWFEAAARQGEPQALYNLSVMYRDGRGITPSRARAYAFFRLSHLASQGAIGAGAQRTLDELLANMTTAERAEAERFDTGWVTGPTALTRLALSGIERAEALARADR